MGISICLDAAPSLFSQSLALKQAAMFMRTVPFQLTFSAIAVVGLAATVGEMSYCRLYDVSPKHVRTWQKPSNSKPGNST